MSSLEKIKLSWQTQDFYNEYLDLKLEIQDLVKRKEFLDGSRGESHSLDIEQALHDKVVRFKFVLEQLVIGGVKLDDLILISIGVDVH